MGNLLKAFFFKLRRDLTFRITLFIGLGLAVFMTGIYLLIDVGINQIAGKSFGDYEWMMCTGPSLLLATLSPAQNFGLAIPINLITFTVLEFTSGTIRNKIITGNSKSKIYFSLFLTGLIFTFALITTYVGLCTAVGSIVGGFDSNGSVVSMTGTGGKMTPEFVWKLLVIAVLVYILITAATIFFATLIRNIGPCIPIVVILLMICYLGATIVGLLQMASGLDNAVFNAICDTIRFIDPLYSLSVFSSEVVGEGEAVLSITNENFIIGVTNNLIYTIAFVIGGWAIFIKRDVK